VYETFFFFFFYQTPIFLLNKEIGVICGTEIKKIALIIFKFDNKEIFLSQIKKRASKNKQTMK
jgi:hypothetical protein